MKITVNEIIRLYSAALLPVPLFSIIYFSLNASPINLGLIYIMIGGYVLMGIPSLAYSFMLELYRRSSRYKMKFYILYGSAMGGLASLIPIHFKLTNFDGMHDSIWVITISSIIGGIIPLILATSLPKHSN